MLTPRSRHSPGTALSNAMAISPRSGNRCWCWTGCRLPPRWRWSQTLRDAGAVRRRAQLALRRPGRARASEARDRSTVNIAASSRGDDMRGLVRHLRATGQLTAGLILRALLSGNLDLFDAALAELSDLPQARVGALLQDGARPACRRC